MNRSALAPLLVAASFLGTGCSAATAAPTYATCAATADCRDSADTCVAITTAELTASECTRACVSDDECPGGGRCVSVDGASTFCQLTCVTSNVCEQGWACTARTDGRDVCLPGTRVPFDPVPPYHPCTPGSDDECSEDLHGCFTLDTDSALAICTSTCSFERPCPDDGECVALDRVDYTCFASCATDPATCLAGFSCRTSLPDGTTFPAACIPD
jgi:hypothetical protein